MHLPGKSTEKWGADVITCLGLLFSISGVQIHVNKSSLRTTLLNDQMGLEAGQRKLFCTVVLNQPPTTGDTANMVAFSFE